MDWNTILQHGGGIVVSILALFLIFRLFIPKLLQSHEKQIKQIMGIHAKTELKVASSLKQVAKNLSKVEGALVCLQQQIYADGRFRDVGACVSGCPGGCDGDGCGSDADSGSGDPGAVGGTAPDRVCESPVEPDSG